MRLSCPHFSCKTRPLLTSLAILFSSPSAALASTIYTYDSLGRLAAAAYDNGLCIAYAYDPNGNRLSMRTVATTIQSSVWGAANWGCFSWTPQ